MKSAERLFCLAKEWVKVVGKIITACKYLYHCEDKSPQKTRMHILQTENTRVTEPHAYVAQGEILYAQQHFLMWIRTDNLGMPSEPVWQEGAGQEGWHGTPTSGKRAEITWTQRETWRRAFPLWCCQESSRSPPQCDNQLVLQPSRHHKSRGVLG